MHSKLNVIWIDAVGCNGCSHSFFNYPAFKELFNKINLLYHPLIYTDELKIQNCDLLIVEGALRDNFPRLGFDLNKLIEKLFLKSKKVLALGTCSSYGGIFGEGLIYNKDRKGRFYEYRDKIINLPGCPPHSEWIAYVIEMVSAGKKILLDEENRPLEIYSYLSHDGCTRNEYFEWKVDALEFGTKEGCLFYYQGCQGPYTHSSCNRMLWNEVSSKPRAGTPCFGCTEKEFPKKNLFKTETFMGMPANIPIGVSKRAYFALAGVAKSLKNERLNKRLIDVKKNNNKN